MSDGVGARRSDGRELMGIHLAQLLFFSLGRAERGEKRRGASHLFSHIMDQRMTRERKVFH